MKTKRLEQLYFECFFGSPSRLFKDLENLFIEVESTVGSAGSVLLEELLQRYTYISEDLYRQSIYLIAEHINDEFDLSKTILCASTSDRHKDSGQMVMYDVCTALAYNHKHTKVRDLNRYDIVIKHIKKKKLDITSIILLDEFVGSGQSMLGRVNKIKDDSVKSKSFLPEIHIFSVAGMNIGLKRVQPHVASIYSCHTLHQGIRGYMKLKDQDFAYQLIDHFENTLNPVVENQELPRRGYEASEALYARDFGNCPNNVFPMFWWPELIDGTKRNPPFSRILSWKS
jgi:hypothetical protein